MSFNNLSIHKKRVRYLQIIKINYNKKQVTAKKLKERRFMQFFIGR